MNEFIKSEAGSHHVHELCGWVGAAKPDLLAEAFELWTTRNPPNNALQALPYKAGSRSMLWEVGRKILGTDPSNYPQQVGDCQIAGSMVTMEDGQDKKIEDVKVGDYVMTHMNRPRRVIRTIHKKYTGKLYTMKGKGHYKENTATADHEYIVYSKDNPHTYQWKAIESITKDEDYLLCSYGIQNVEYQYVEYDGRKILIDEDFATIFGWYLSEGGTSERELLDGTTSTQKVTFNLGKHENEQADYIIQLLKSVFGVTGVKQFHKFEKGSILVEVYHVTFASFVKKIVPGNIYSKRVPSIFIRSPSRVKMALLRAWVNGDGYRDPRSKLALGCSVSLDMIRDFAHISTSLGLNHNIYYRKETEKTKKTGIINFRGSAGCKLLGLCMPNRDSSRFSNLGLLRRVSHIEYKEVENIDVYCLEVEGDHSFIVNGYATSNCGSFASKNAIEYVQFYPIVNGARDQWTRVFPPYLYGCGRVFVGQGKLGYGDGSFGSWQAEAVKQYGTIPIDAPNCPAYSGEVARKWGYEPGPPQEFVTVGKQHIVKSATPAKTWEELVVALTNGYPVTIASDVGFDMAPRADGFNHYSTSWAHCMCIIGVDDDPGDPYAAILNSWGVQAFGPIKDFKTGEMWPGGTLRVRKKDIEIILSQGDSFAYSALEGFPAQQLPENLFDLW